MPTWSGCLAFSPGGKTLASGGWDKVIKLWDVAAGQERATLRGHSAAIAALAFAPGGRQIALGGLRPARQALGRRRAADAPRAVLKGHVGKVWYAVYSPDGQTLATGGQDKSVRLWDVASGTPRAVLEGSKFGVLLRRILPRRQVAGHGRPRAGDEGMGPGDRQGRGDPGHGGPGHDHAGPRVRARRQDPGDGE